MLKHMIDNVFLFTVTLITWNINLNKKLKNIYSNLTYVSTTYYLHFKKANGLMGEYVHGFCLRFQRYKIYSIVYAGE